MDNYGKDDKDQRPDTAPYRRCRVWLAVLIFFGSIFFYCQRVGMSVAVVCMVNQTAVRLEREGGMVENSGVNTSINVYGVPHNVSQIGLNIVPKETQCGLQETGSKTMKDGPFVWNKQMQGHIHASFYYGYLVSQIPTSMLVQRFNGKWVFAAMYAATTLGTLITPMAANMGYWVLIGVRVLVGVGSGGIFPATHYLLGQWAPPLERSLLTGIAYAGLSLGNVVAFPISGALCSNGFSEGWDSIFYVFGIISIVWLVIWILLVAETPSSCRIISKVEANYINNSLQGQLTSGSDKKSVKTPWGKILTSPAVWAIIAANVTSDYGLYTLLTCVPTYMHEVLGFDMISNGLFSALPFLGMWMMMTAAAQVSDKLQSNQVLSTGWCRKLFNSIGELGACIFLIALGYISCDQAPLAVALLTLGASMHGSAFAAYLVNPMDIAPQFAGSIFAVSNCLGSVTGFIAPPVAAALTPNQTREEWQRVFFVSSAIYALGGVLYIILSRGALQPWAVSDDTSLHEKTVAMEMYESESLVAKAADAKKKTEETKESFA